MAASTFQSWLLVLITTCLCKFFLFLKIRQAIFDLDPSSAASPYGFNGNFYTIEWPFLLQTLGAFGFDPIFMKWIAAILNSAYVSFLFNAKVFGFFQCSQGVRQGDILCPQFFSFY